MADFKTHLTASTFVGVGYGALIHSEWQIPLTTSIISGALCGLAGMLPDIDSDTGNAQREILTFMAGIMPMLMIERFALLGLSPEQMVIATGCVYIIVRFGFGEILRRYTVHRGMFHSIPAALVAGLITVMVCNCEVPAIKIVKAIAVSLGYLVHLVVDEIWAFDSARLRVKKSFGTALKMFSNRWIPNVVTYGMLLFVSILAYEDSNLMFGKQQNQEVVKDVWAEGDKPAEGYSTGIPHHHHDQRQDFNFGFQGEANIGNGGFQPPPGP